MRVRLASRTVLWSILVVVLVAAAYAGLRARRGGLIDFVVPRTAAARFLAHEQLYRPEDGHYQYKYLPAFAAFMVPFTWMPKEVAEAAWFALTVAMAWALVRLAVHALPERRLPISHLVWWTLLLNAKFLLKELGFGQFNLPLALLFWGAIVAAQRGRAELAGALVAAGAFVKPYALVLLPWLVWTQRRRSLLPFALVLAAGLALPAVAYGWDGNLALLRDWYRTVTDTTAPNLATNENVSFAAMWARWLPAGPRTSMLALISAALAMIAGLALLWRRRSVAEPNYLEGAYFAVLVPLVSPQGWDYVLIVALPAYTCLVDRWRDTSVPWRAVTLAGILLTSCGTYEVMRRTIYYLVMGWGGGTVGAVLIALSLLGLRRRALA
ncbi:MAG TPA: glycosyltransferase family 87 protein [Vicinamibacterales bacterium]|nr:glycosyltransferase family 87 protein [Vicinamibacterales bacterium]